jgi:protocatechuate 3,4-dioxygenase beta subunit
MQTLQYLSAASDNIGVHTRENRAMGKVFGWTFAVLAAGIMGAGAQTPALKPAGTVVDPDGKPMAGVSVTLLQVDVAAQAGGFESKPVKEITTGADGAYAFSLEGVAPSTKRGRLGIVIAKKEGYGLGWANWQSTQDSSPRPITLKPAVPLSGVVRTQAGAPIEGARVRISLLAYFREQRPEVLSAFLLQDDLTAITGAEGAFSFSHIPEGASAEFLVSKEGCAQVATFSPKGGFGNRTLTYKAGREDIVFELAPESRVSGIVKRADTKEPVPGVTLNLQSGPVPFNPFSGMEPVRSGEDGTFEFRGLPGGTYRLGLSPEPDPEWTAAEVPVEVPEGAEVKGIVLTLGRGGTLEVTVQEGEENPVAIPEATVFVRTEAGQGYQEQTDTNGVATFKLAPGRYILQHVYSRQGITVEPKQAELSVAEGETTRHTVVAKPRPRIRGVVRGPDGEPVEGVAIAVLPAGYSGQGTSDAKGNYTAAWDENTMGGGRETTFVVVARHVEKNLAVRQDVAGPGQLDLNLQQGAVLTGKVTDELGNALAEATVSLMIRGKMWGASMQGASVKTDAEGTFRLTAVPRQGECSVEVGCEGYGRASSPLQEAELMANDTVTVPPISLRVADQRIAGKVIDEDGKPVSEAQVSAYGTGQPHSSGQTDAEGRFVIEGLCPGDLHVNAYHQGPPMRHGTLRTEAGDEDIELEISENPQGYGGYRSPKIPAPELGPGKDFDPARAAYWQDFEKRGPGPEWSRQETYRVPGVDDNLLGVFASDAVRLRLKELPAHGAVKVYCELYTLATWDGMTDHYGNEVWEVRLANGPRLIFSSFANAGNAQSHPFPHPYAKVGVGTAGRRLNQELPWRQSTWSSHAVYPMCFTVRHSGGELELIFAGINLQGADDENWGLGSVGVELLPDIAPVPLTEQQLAASWAALGKKGSVEAYSAMQRLIAAGDQAVAFIGEQYGWEPRPEWEGELLELLDVFQYDDESLWKDAAEQLEGAEVRLNALVAWCLDKRRFAAAPPPWLEETMGPATLPVPKTEEARRAGRAAWVLERIWSPKARALLLMEEPLP